MIGLLMYCNKSVTLVLISPYYCTRMFEQAFHTWGVCRQSHLKLSTYSPGSRSSGTSTRSLKAYSRPLRGLSMFNFAHMEPAGVVPSVVVISSTGVQVFSVTSPFLALKSIHVVSPGKQNV